MKRRDLSPLQCNRVNQCFLPCPDKEKITSKFEIKDLRKSSIIIPPFKQLIIHTQIATRHLNETPHGWYVIWIASCPSKKRTAISSPLFSTLFSQISFTNLKKDECNAISLWYTREEVKGLFNFLLRWPAHQEEIAHVTWRNVLAKYLEMIGLYYSWWILLWVHYYWVLDQTDTKQPLSLTSRLNRKISMHFWYCT